MRPDLHPDTGADLLLQISRQQSPFWYRCNVSSNRNIQSVSTQKTAVGLPLSGPSWCAPWSRSDPQTPQKAECVAVDPAKLIGPSAEHAARAERGREAERGKGGQPCAGQRACAASPRRVSTAQRSGHPRSRSCRAWRLAPLWQNGGRDQRPWYHARRLLSTR